MSQHIWETSLSLYLMIMHSSIIWSDWWRHLNDWEAKEWLRAFFKDVFLKENFIFAFIYYFKLSIGKVLRHLHQTNQICLVMTLRYGPWSGWNPYILALLQKLLFGESNEVNDMNIFGLFHCDMKLTFLANCIK